MESNNQGELLSNRTKQLEEEYEDIVWRLMMDDYAKHKGEEYLKLNEQIKNDPRYEMSEAGDKRIFQTLDRHFREKRLRTLKNKARKILSKVGIIFIVFGALFTVTFTTVEAFRLQVLNFFWIFEKEYTSVKLDESEPSKNIAAELSDAYAPSYVPEGYWIDDIIEIGYDKIIEYINEDGKTILFHETNSSSSIINIDAEDAEIVKPVRVHEAEGIFVFKNDVAKISWSADNKIFVISAQISEDEIVQIAESVVFIK